MSLDDKIKNSLDLLREGEKLALSLNPDFGYYLAFSGGKDSQVVYQLAKMAGVKFKAFYSVTSIDPPQNVYFIRKNYPDVEFVHPKKNFFRLVEDKGLPYMHMRFCCERLKEGLGAGTCVLNGVRALESKRRASMYQIEVFSRRKEHEGKSKERTIAQLMETEHQCIKGKDKVMVRPVFHWTTEEIWEFIYKCNLPLNPCYELVGRVGCMFCPFASEKQMQKYVSIYPKFKDLLIRSLNRYRVSHPDKIFDTAEEYLTWWMSGRSIKKYMRNKSQLSLDV